MAKVNRKWHDKNKLPKRATTKQRLKWHEEHAKKCGCRPIPAKIQRAIDKNVVAVKPVKSSKSTKTKKPTKTTSTNKPKERKK